MDRILIDPDFSGNRSHRLPVQILLDRRFLKFLIVFSHLIILSESFVYHFLIPSQFEAADNFGDEGLAAVKLNSKYGFINNKGEFVISPQFEYIYKPFSYGLSYVQQNGNNRYIDKTGKLIWKQD